MKIPHYVMPKIRTAILAAFAGASFLVLGYFWTGVGGYVPLYTQPLYTFQFTVDRVSNLVPQSDVSVAGILVGNVETITTNPDGTATVVANISDEQALPLHDGVTGRISAKTLIEESYVQLVDGPGAELESGTVLPTGAIIPAVVLDDVLEDLPESDRVALAATLQSLGEGSQDAQAGVAGALRGLGFLGREGGTALTALSDQSAALEELSMNTARVLAALDTRQGQIAQLVADAGTVTGVVSDNAGDLEEFVRTLPGVLNAADAASDDISALAAGLDPVAANLSQAAPFLRNALEELPETSTNLRELLPSLNTALDRSPATFRAVPAVADDLEVFLPQADGALAHLNPMVGYLQPYGGDVYQFFTSFGWTVSRGNTDGNLLRVMPVFHAQSFKGSPVNANEVSQFDDYNPYPAPGVQETPPDDSPPPDHSKLEPSTAGEN
ncbi:MAG: MlaD family protein [Pseudonocardia sp.]